MARYAMVIKTERCVGCQSCTVACKSEWKVPNGFARTRVPETGTRGTFPNSEHLFSCQTVQSLRPAHVRSGLS